MFRNYLTTALRNIATHRLYGFINVVGLAAGLVCVTFIILLLRDEISYNKWIPDSQNIYRVEATFYQSDRGHDFFTVVPFPVTIAMQAKIPEVLAQTHLIPETMTAEVAGRQFTASIAVVDPNFFQMIKLPLVRGNPVTVLAQPESIVLSQATAIKYFGKTDPIGKTITLGGSHPLTVTGVLRDLPHNTDIQADLVMPNTSKADTLSLSEKNEWLDVDGWGFVRLAAGADAGAVLAKLKPILDKSIDAKKEMNLDVKGSELLRLHLIPLWDIHLAPGGQLESGGWGMIYGFGAIAGLILLIACFNFMNLATARATLRAREVSLRKVMGARRGQLILQFLGESVMMALVALILALALVEILLPAFDSFLARPITFNYLADWPLTLGVAVTAIAAGLIAGIYPALVLSSFRPAATLGTNASGISGSGILRTILVVLQFAVSIGLGIATLVVFAQIRYARQIDLGFDRHNLVVITGAGSVTPSAFSSMAHALAADPAIAGVAQSNMVPFGGGILVDPVQLPAGTKTFVIREDEIDPDFLSVYGMKLLAGRNLSPARGEDVVSSAPPKTANANGNVLINAAAAREFGYTVSGAIGRSIFFGSEKRHLTIVGVVADANFDGFETAIQPFIYFHDPQNVGHLSIRLKPADIPAGLAAIDRIWRQFAPGVAIERHFQDENFDRQFLREEREGAIFGLFVGIAIFIACLGLFGLAAFTAQRRTKEIGLRKTFGARTSDIVRLLLWQFSIPVLIANVIAWPVAWFYLNHWLQTYAYRIFLNPLYFLGAGIIALLIAWVTIFAHALRVARANPIHALRYE